MIATLLSSRAGEAVLFATVVVFTVGSLEMFRMWMERGAGVARSRMVAALLALAFLGIAAIGVADYAFAGKLNLLNLGFFLAGAAGLGILPSLLFPSNKDEELRRIAAHDL